MANDDPLLTTMRFIPQHDVVQKYGAILPDYLTTQAMKESEAYKTYHDLATGKVQPKPKYVRRSSRSKTEQAPKPFLEVALTDAEQLKLATKRSLIQTHISHASRSGAHEGIGVKLGVPDVPTYRSDEEEISWKSSDEEDDDEANIGKDEDDNDQEDDDNTDHDDEAKQEEEVKKEESFDPIVQTPSQVKNTDDEDNDDDSHGMNVEKTNWITKEQMKRMMTVNEQLDAEVLTRSSNSSKTSHAVTTNLYELELKKILIDKMESNKSIHISDEHKNLYKDLVDAYECDKLILDTYGDTVTLKRRRDDEDKDEEPSAGSNWGSKRRRAGKEPESTSAPKEKTSKTTGQSTKGSKSHHKSASESTQAEDPMHTTKDLE
nr:hypothetical protein [Tanacetum cinerariifolium]